MTGFRVLGMTGFRVWGMTGFRVLGMTGFRVLGMTGFKVLGMTGFKVLGMTGFRVWGMKGHRVQGLHIKNLQLFGAVKTHSAYVRPVWPWAPALPDLEDLASREGEPMTGRRPPSGLNP